MTGSKNRIRRKVVFLAMLPIIGLTGYCGLMSFYQHSAHDVLFETSDLVAALMKYVEDHCGELPDSPEEFLELACINGIADGGIMVSPSCASTYIPKIYGVPVRPGWRTSISWGIDPLDQPSAGHDRANKNGQETGVVAPLDSSAFAIEIAPSFPSAYAGHAMRLGANVGNAP
jgi:hypothetical protein